MGTKTIDEFVVAIGLDVKSLTAGQKTAFTRLDELEQKSDKTRKTVQSSGKAMGESFAGVTGELFKLTGAFIGISAFKNATVEITKADAALGRLSRNLGVDPKSLKAWEGVANAYGSSVDDIDAAFQRTNDVVTKWRVMGATPGDAFFKGAGLLGLDQSKFFSEGASDEERLIMLQKIMSARIADGTYTRAGVIAVAEEMGYSRQTLQALLDTNGVLDEQLAKYAALNNLSEASTKDAIIREQAWKSLQSTVEGVYRSMLDGMTEVFSKEAAHNAEAEGRAPMTLKRGLASTMARILGDGEALHEIWMPEGASCDANEIWGGANDKFYKGSQPAVAPARSPSSGGGDNAARLAYAAKLDADYGLPAGTMRGVLAGEGTIGGKNTGVSPKGAMGSWQLMPKTAQHYGVDPNNFEQSGAAAAALMKELLTHYSGNVAYAYGGYNAGQPAMDRALRTGRMPLETQGYIPRAMAGGPGATGGTSTQTSTTSIGNVNVYAGNASSSDIAARINNGSIHTYAANNGMPGVTQR